MSKPHNRDQPLSRRAIEGMIADGKSLVVYEGQVLQLDSWMDKHPGGRLALQHMVGNDATCEIKAYHRENTLKTMTAYRIGRITSDWANFTPPIRGGVFRKLTPVEKVCTLDAEVVEEILKAKHDIWIENARISVASVDSDSVTTSDPSISPPLSRSSSVTSLSSFGSPSVQPASDSARDHGIAKAMQSEIDACLASYPSPDAATQAMITEKYEAMHRRVKEGGFYVCDLRDYGRESIRYGFLFALFLFLLSRQYYVVSALSLGAFWQQIMFTAHDAGHRAITQNTKYDTIIGIFIADFCCGLSFGWWKSSHNVHHLVTNSPEHDPDIQNTPLFATCPSQLNDTHSTYYNFDFVWDNACEVLVPYQKYVYYPIMAFARFNLYALGWCHIISGRAKSSGAPAWTRRLEVMGMAFYWFFYGYILVWRTLPDWPTRVAFVLSSHLSSMLLHVQITLSHWGMPTCELGNDESFAQKQLRTTMDVMCPIWLDWLHGGLQFQAIHHLFPRVPRHNLRKLQPMVQQFCAETGIKYSIHGFVEGNGTVIGRLEGISKTLSMLVECQDHMAKTGESGLH